MRKKGRLRRQLLRRYLTRFTTFLGEPSDTLKFAKKSVNLLIRYAIIRNCCTVRYLECGDLAGAVVYNGKDAGIWDAIEGGCGDIYSNYFKGPIPRRYVNRIAKVLKTSKADVIKRFSEEIDDD